MLKNVMAVVAVLAVALLVVGLTFSATQEERADYIFVNNTEPKTLDPAKATGQPEGRVLMGLFEGLTFWHPETLAPVPGMAERWEVSDDGLEYVFHIRPDVRWSNGDPVTADDFVYAWKRLLDPETASQYAGLIHMVVHAEAFNTYGAQVKALRGDPTADEAKQRKGIIASLRELAASHGGTVPAAAWVDFMFHHKLQEAVIRPKDPAVAEALGRVEGRLSEAEVDALLAGLGAEAERRAAELEEAEAHLGKDEGFYAPDKRRFVVELRAFTPYFLDLTSFYVLLPVHPPTVDKAPENWFMADTIVSNGPFLMDRWVSNQKIRLRKNPDHWDAENVHLETVDILAVENRTTSLNLYLTDELDWVSSAYPPELIDRLWDRPDFYHNPGFITYFYRLNTTHEGLRDPRVRQAIGLAFDRTEITDQVVRKGDRPATTLVPPGVRGYEPPESALGFDLERARELMAEAGYDERDEDGILVGFPTLTILHNTDEGHKKIAEYIAQQLENNLGIDAVARNKEWQAYLEAQKKLDYVVARAGWIGDYLDPMTFLDMFTTGNGNNETGWGDVVYDRLVHHASDIRLFLDDPEPMIARMKEPEVMRGLLDDLESAPDPESRRAVTANVRFHLLREAEAILFQDAFPIIPIYFYEVSGLVKPNVKGFYTEVRTPDGGTRPNLQDLHPYRYVRVVRDGEPADE